MPTKTAPRPEPTPEQTARARENAEFIAGFLNERTSPPCAFDRDRLRAPTCQRTA